MEKVKTFCLHHTGAPERKEKLLPVFDALKIDVEWVESFHPSEIDRSTLNIQNDKMNMGVISLYLKHQYCYEQQKLHSYDNILVFEDDILLPEWSDQQFWDFINEVTQELDSINGDIVFIGECCHIKPYNSSWSGKYVYHHPSYRSRCTHCYLSSHRCVDIMLKELPSMKNAMDWRFNEMIADNNLKSCYSDPSFLQSTEHEQEPSLLKDELWKK